MENASKALIIAGGILLALLILSVLIYVGTTLSNMANQQNQSKQLEQTAEFNRTYEAYNRSRLYGTDVISVVNRAIDYNKQLDADEEEYFINIVIITLEGKTYTITTDAGMDLNNYKNSKFTCTGLEDGTSGVVYDSNGKIKQMTFKQRQ